jgi:N-acetylneuraminic acid mutarotase
MRLGIGLAAGLVCTAALAADPIQRTLTFEERVKAQTAIERVYYSHQTGATKPFEEALPKAAIEAKVRKSLEQTAALNLYWKTAVTDESLQRELERMAAGTRMPERLQELYAALGNDPFLVKECLARATLVDRLTRNFYAFDQTMHAKERAQAEELRRRLVSGELHPAAENPFRVVTDLVVGKRNEPSPSSLRGNRRVVTAEELKKISTGLPEFVGRASEIDETEDAFAIRVVLSRTSAGVRIASYLVRKASWESWWHEARQTLRISLTPVATGAAEPAFPLASKSSNPTSSCRDDAWDSGSLDDNAPNRTLHTSVWTGSEMIVWGGTTAYQYDQYPLPGARYDPVTDNWRSISTQGAPLGRVSHTAIWTGSQMVVWGGSTSPGSPYGTQTGARYDPVTDRWSTTSGVGAPSARAAHTAVWTGRYMLVWGGYATNSFGAAGPPLKTGGRYDPQTDSWSPTSTIGAPTARSAHTAVWTGSHMVIWGGEGYPGALHNTGGRYDPGTDSWTPTSTDGAPMARVAHAAIWTGSEMLVWGGYGYVGAREGGPVSYELNSGARYDPSLDRWVPMSTVQAPAGRTFFTAIWTGHLMVVWGGYAGVTATKTGGRYDPATDTWASTSLTGAPSARLSHTAVWTGHVMVTWGGSFFFLGPPANTGGRYDPLSDSWTPTSVSNGPTARVEHTAVWTGNVMVVWGGNRSSNNVEQLIDTGARYDPAIDNWAPTSQTNAPSPRRSHTAVWNGSQMIVWGGDADQSVALNSGSRYDPLTDQWSATSIVGAPAPRRFHDAVWTGTRMLVWGGLGDDYFNSGGRYDPSTDSWAPTSIDGAPSARVFFTTVWTENEMVVWGGAILNSGTILLNDGGRYDPETDTWRAISTDGAPSARVVAPGVWTGTSMLLWGGEDAQGRSNTGGRYDPAADAWSPIATSGAPTPRSGHSLVWTGNLAIVWGGRAFPQYFNPGGMRYDPATDRWSSLPLEDAPYPRSLHRAVWTGNLMMVWGGFDELFQRPLGNGGRYSIGTFVDDDCDADGYTEAAGDCDDRNPAMYPGAPQLCDGVNNDCADPSWPQISPVEYDRDGDGFPVCGNDCDDLNPNVYPAAAQLCDGLNNDCSDQNWPTPAPDETDADGDRVPLCGDDCDDTNPSIGPAFWEWCDGLDNDCNGAVDDGLALWNCEDQNPCTTDECGGSLGCRNVNNTIPCDDGNSCTSPDACGGGVCHGVPLNGTVCTDNNACTVDDTCVNGSCHSGLPRNCDDGNACNGEEFCSTTSGCYPSVPPDCDDYNLCTDDDCQPSSGCEHRNNTAACTDSNDCTANDHCANGRCESTPLNGDSCSDFNACTQDDRCVTGVCVGGPLIVCNDGNVCNGVEYCAYYAGCLPGDPLLCFDGNVCTDDSCDPSAGCRFTDNSIGCSDNNPCTDNDTCTAGACIGTPEEGTACDDGNACTLNDTVCSDGYCHGTTPLNCDDGNECNGAEYCDWANGCQPGYPMECGDNNPCTDDSCTPGVGCVYTNSAASCDDGLPCTSSDTCTNGFCVGIPDDTNACNDLNDCTVGDHCESGVCRSTPRNCDDGNFCNGVEQCAFGVGCVPGIPVDCDDQDVCDGIETCNPAGGCIPGTPLNCGDGNPCNGVEYCDPFDGCQAVPTNCDDGNPCTIDGCSPDSGCTNTPTSSVCDDGDPCTSGDTCATGVCTGSPTSGGACSDGNACTLGDTCTNGICIPGSGSLNCDDSDVCTLDFCSSASGCQHDPSIGGKCDDGNPCTLNACDPVLFCVFPPAPAGGGCEDFDPCTTQDRCDGHGNCFGRSVCDDGNQCTDDYGDPGQSCACSHEPSYPGTQCNDGNPCTIGEVCDGSGTPAGCGGGTPLNCDDNNPCTDDACNVATGCVHTNNSASCSDNDLCTFGDTCQSGACIPGPSGLNEPKPRTSGYYRQLCQGPYLGDQLTSTDAACVASISQTFASISAVADICVALRPGSPNASACDNAEDDLMVLALNVCRARVCTAQNINSQCGNNRRVGQSLSQSDAILSSPSRTAEACADAKCLDDEINSGRALEMNSLTLRREGSAVRLEWRAPYLDGGAGRPTAYRIWRRAQSGPAPFVQIGETADPTYLDTNSGTGAYQYEVTAVMN